MSNEVKNQGPVRTNSVERATPAEPASGRGASVEAFGRFLGGIDRTGWAEAVGRAFPPLAPDAPGARPDPLAGCTRVVHTGAGPIKGTIFLCIDASYKGPGTAGDEAFVAELKAALDKTDYGRFYDVRLVTAADGIETVARHNGVMNRPPNMALVVHGDPAETNPRWNAAIGAQDFPFTTTGLAPGPFDQPVSVGRLASRPEYTNPRLAAFVACHEIGHRLFDVADGTDLDRIGGWGDFPYEPGSTGISGSYNLMTDGGAMMGHLNQLNQGKSLAQYTIPAEYYRMPQAFLDGLGQHPGIMRYLAGLPTW